MQTTRPNNLSTSCSTYFKPRSGVFSEHKKRFAHSDACGLKGFLKTAFSILIVFGVSACGSLPREPVPVDEIRSAYLPGFADVRTVGLYGEQTRQIFEEDLVASWQREIPDTLCEGPDKSEPHHCVLILSGGGGFGAFGAGIMRGWTGSGTRPNFKFVTGISTGALIAPFAFLGPDYDEQLEQAFTSIKGEKDVLRFRSIVDIFFSESLAESDPLAKVIAAYVDKDFLAAIAAEHRRGKRLYIGTTHLDAQRFVAWNMGAIAQKGTDEALRLFRSVVLASASIPGAFPPVMIPVDTPSGTYDEMHVDGGVETQFFFPGDVLEFPTLVRRLEADGLGDRIIPGNFRIYVIRNSRLRARQSPVDRNIGKISARAVSTMIQTMGQADLYRIFAVSKSRGNDFNYVEVPSDHEWQSDDQFDQAEMIRLFEIGRSMGATGDFWDKKPLGTFAENLTPIDSK